MSTGGGPVEHVNRGEPLSPVAEGVGGGEGEEPTEAATVLDATATEGAGVAEAPKGDEVAADSVTKARATCQPVSASDPRLGSESGAVNESAQPAYVTPPEVELGRCVQDGPFTGRPLLAGDSISVLENPPSPVVDTHGGYRPEVAAESFGLGGLWVAAASVRGFLHQSLTPSTVRQDAFALGVTPDGSHVVAAVADGVSQGHYSHIAADRAAEAARRAVLSALPGPVDWAAVTTAARTAVRAALLSMWKPSSPDQPEPTDEALAPYAATTLSVLVVALAATDGAREVISARLAGDGNAYLLAPGRGWRRLHGGKVGDVQLNKVTPLPRDPGPPDVVTTLVHPGQAAVVATDGISDMLHDGSRRVSAHLYHSWLSPLATAEYLRSVSFIYLPSDDDRTAVTVWSA